MSRICSQCELALPVVKPNCVVVLVHVIYMYMYQIYGTYICKYNYFDNIIEMSIDQSYSQHTCTFHLIFIDTVYRLLKLFTSTAFIYHYFYTTLTIFQPSWNTCPNTTVLPLFGIINYCQWQCCEKGVKLKRTRTKAQCVCNHYNYANISNQSNSLQIHTCLLCETRHKII